MTRESLNTIIKEKMAGVLSDELTLKMDFDTMFTNWFQNLIKLARQRKLTEDLKKEVQEGEKSAA